MISSFIVKHFFGPLKSFLVDEKRKDTEHTWKPQLSMKGFRFFIGIALALGLFLRVSGIDKKIYQHDEVMTSMRVAGLHSEEVRAHIAMRQEIGMHDLQVYQQISAERGVYATLHALAVDDPKHPPLYYVLARLWAYVFGDSTFAFRSLSVLLSLLALVGFYWLCQELFQSSSVTWMAVALAAISPFHILYAQEARQYSLWTLTVILSSAALLRALRRQTWRAWGVYATTVAMGLYAHTLFVLVSFAHGVYALAYPLLTSQQGATGKSFFSLPKSTGAYVAATLAAFLAFAPWAIIIMVQLPVLHENTRWIMKEVDFLYVVKHGVLGFSSLFFDPNGGVIFAARANTEKPLTYLMRLPILLLITLSFFFLYHKTPRRVWLFVFILVGGTIAPLLLADAITGWRSSTPFRYLIPSYLGVQLSVAYLLTSGMASSKVFWRTSWRLAAVLLATGMVASCVRNAQAAVWWNKEASYALPHISRVINRKVQPLLLSTLNRKNLGNVIALSYLLDEKVRFRTISDSHFLMNLDGFTDVFILHPSDHVRQLFKTQGYRLHSEIRSGELWRLSKEPSEAFNDENEPEIDHERDHS